ncbi:PAS domain S-box protein [Syntrophus sp. (in: bacteria)]|uniref:PAS domain S-box protein n=1 Tax=Syntrophus sp. (in: bacteria) TaxID=48412 RepID=UPI00345ECACC
MKRFTCLFQLIWAALFVLLSAWPVQAQWPQGKSRVLIIHSYHSGLTWTDAIMNGIRDTFAASDPGIQISAEYLDSRRYPKSDLSRRIREFLLEKLNGTTPDLVMVSDNNALELVLEQRNRLFPGIPIVFCGINDFSPAMISSCPDITGVAEDLSIVETVNLALRLHPDTGEIVVIGRTTVAADRYNRDSFIAALPRVPSHLKVTFWDDLPGPELKSRLEKLESGTVLFINGLITDHSGRQMMYGETTKWISQYSKVPAYSFWEVYLGYGIVGGKLVSGYRQGRMAGQLALRILRGERADRIPVVAGLDANHYMLDYRQLERFRIPLSKVPQGTLFVHRPDSFYDRHKTLVWTTVSVVAALGALVILLSTAILHRRNAERALKVSEERMRLFFERQIVGMAIASPEMGWLQVNDRLCRMLGYSREELLRKTWTELTYPDDLAADIEQFDRLLAGAINEYTLEKRFVRRDGTIIFTDLSVGCVRNARGRVDYVLALLEDITERKEAAGEREKLQEQLIQAQKLESIGRLAGGVAHDFNNMLTAILGHVELSMRLCTPEGPIYTSLKVIEESALRSAGLVRQLLAFARRQTVAPKVLDVNDTTASMLKMLQRLMGESISLVWLPQMGLWPVRVDPSQIDQLLVNLCINARDAIPGVGRVTIETGNKVLDETYCAVHPDCVPGEYVMLAVSDDGDGIGKDALGHIFEPFFTTKEPGRGTGLGLSTFYGIVKQNNGYIHVCSEPGKGSTFRIYLPRFAGDAGEPAVESKAEPPGSRGETVLLVEDEAVILHVGQAMLEALGYRVLTADTPGKALQQMRARSGEIDLVLTDVVMPEMNGRELAERLLDIKPGLKCLFASGYTADVIARDGVLEEGVVFIQKPFSIKHLAAKVREALERE